MPKVSTTPKTAKPDDWMNAKWRPAMGWVYMVTCITDFIIFPVLWAILHAYLHQKIEPWDPLTLKGAGLFHLAMGAVLGVAAWSRGQEKMTMMNQGFTTGPQPTPYQSNSSYNAQQQTVVDNSYYTQTPIMPTLSHPRPSRPPREEEMPVRD